MFELRTVWLAYKDDNFHSLASRDLLCVTSNKATAVGICKKVAKKEYGYKLNKHDKWNLDNINQTQGYKGDGEFHLEEVNLNTLL